LRRFLQALAILGMGALLMLAVLNGWKNG